MAKKMSKWQKASVMITRLKWDIEKALTEDFTEEDKESPKYQQLLETLDLLINHCIGQYREEKEKEREQDLEKLKRKAAIWGTRSLMIALISGTAIELIKFLWKVASKWLGAS
jgi:hypothetical protein